MASGQVTPQNLILDETVEKPFREPILVSDITDTFNQSGIEKALSDSIKILELDTASPASAKIYDIAEVKNVEMFEGLPGQHIRHIKTDYKVFLYSLDEFQGLIAIRGSQILAHYAFKNEDDRTLKILDDIDQNGFSEILIQSMKIDRRGYFRNSRIVEFNQNGIAEKFYLQTFEQRTDVPVFEAKILASKIYVQKDKNPIFFEEKFEKDGNKWKSVEKLKKLSSLSGNIVNYVEITKPIF